MAGSGLTGWRLGGVLSSPAGIALGIMFFTPWLQLSCDPGQGGEDAGPGKAVMSRFREEAPKGLIDDEGRIILAQASGYDLARGELSPPDVEQPPGQMQQQDPPSIDPRYEYWAALGLAILLFIGGISVMVGGTSPRAWALIALLASAAGVGISYRSVDIDLVEDLRTAAENDPDMAENPMAASMNEMFFQAMQTEPTQNIWIMMAIYGGVTVVSLPGLVFSSSAKVISSTPMVTQSGPSPGRQGQSPGQPNPYMQQSSTYTNTSQGVGYQAPPPMSGPPQGQGTVQPPPSPQPAPPPQQEDGQGLFQKPDQPPPTEEDENNLPPKYRR